MAALDCIQCLTEATLIWAECNSKMRLLNHLGCNSVDAIQLILFIHDGESVHWRASNSGHLRLLALLKRSLYKKRLSLGALLMRMLCFESAYWSSVAEPTESFYEERSLRSLLCRVIWLSKCSPRHHRMLQKNAAFPAETHSTSNQTNQLIQLI